MLLVLIVNGAHSRSHSSSSTATERPHGTISDTLTAAQQGQLRAWTIQEPGATSSSYARWCTAAANSETANQDAADSYAEACERTAEGY